MQTVDLFLTSSIVFPNTALFISLKKSFSNSFLATVRDAVLVSIYFFRKVLSLYFIPRWIFVSTRQMLEVGLENWEIVPLLTLECTQDEIHAFERKWADLLEADLNSISLITTAEELSRRNAEYYANNRKEIRKQQAEYREKNRKEIRKQQAEYREKNRETIRERAAVRRKKIKESKKFFCGVCELSFESRREQRNHTETLKHQFTFLNSLD